MLFWGFFIIVCIEYLGLVYFFPPLKYLHVTTFVAVFLFLIVVKKYGIRGIVSHRQTKVLVCLIILTFFSIIHAFVQTYSYQAFRAHLGYFMLFVIAFYVLNDFKKIKRFVYLFTILHLALVVVNLPKLLSGTRAENLKAGYFLGDGNDFGWGLNIVLPFTLYAFLAERSKIKKILAGLAFGCIGFGIIATASRGAALAMAGSLTYFWIRSKRKIWGLLFLCIVVVGIISFAPNIFFERMSSLKNYQQESSAVGRLTAWKAATKMALDHPILGVGADNFNSIYGRFYREIETKPSFYASARWISAHSIYFVVLAEYGFPGLLLLLSIIFLNYKENRTSKELIEKNQEKIPIPYYWPDFMNMSLFGYAIGGIFLGGIKYPHLYVITFLTLCTKVSIESFRTNEKNTF